MHDVVVSAVMSAVMAATTTSVRMSFQVFFLFSIALIRKIRKIRSPNNREASLFFLEEGGGRREKCSPPLPNVQCLMLNA